MKLQIIQLEPYDDLASVRDRFAFAQAERVLLVYPGGAHPPILNRKLDLVLMLREASRRGIRLALVSRDPDVLEAAGDVNLSVFPSVRASQRRGWKKPLNQVFVDHAQRPRNAPDPHELLLRQSRMQVLSPRQRQTRRLTRYGAVAALVGAVLLIAYLLLPGAEITLYPASAQIDTTLTLIADTSLLAVDVEGKRIPAFVQEIEVETQASLPTTGIIDVPTTRARGVAVFYNRIESEVFIPRGTVVATAGARPSRFVTLEEATLAAGVGQTADVPIEAADDTPGTRGNVSPEAIVAIEGDLARLLSVNNPEEVTGGLVREQNIVTQADIDKLLVLAREKLRQDALGAFGAQLGGAQFVVPESIVITNEGAEEATYSAFIGDAADTLTLTLRGRVAAFIVDEGAARGAAVAQLSAQIPPGRQLLIDSIRYTRGAVRLAPDGRSAVLAITASGNVAARIDSEAIRRRVAGMSPAEALATLNRELLLDPRHPPAIQVFPPFFWQLPSLPARIGVTVARG